MQINQYGHGSHFRSVDEMFDPEQNVQYAASYLKSLYQSRGFLDCRGRAIQRGPGNPPGAADLCLRGHRRYGRQRRGPLDPNARAFAIGTAKTG